MLMSIGASGSTSIIILRGYKWGKEIFWGGKTLKKSFVLTTLYRKMPIFSWFHRKLVHFIFISQKVGGGQDKNLGEHLPPLHPPPSAATDSCQGTSRTVVAFRGGVARSIKSHLFWPLCSAFFFLLVSLIWVTKEGRQVCLSVYFFGFWWNSPLLSLLLTIWSTIKFCLLECYKTYPKHMCCHLVGLVGSREHW